MLVYIMSTSDRSKKRGVGFGYCNFKRSSVKISVILKNL